MGSFADNQGCWWTDTCYKGSSGSASCLECVAGPDMVDRPHVKHRARLALRADRNAVIGFCSEHTWEEEIVTMLGFCRGPA